MINAIGDNYKLVNTIQLYKGGQLMKTLIDTAINGEPHFTREIGSRKYLHSNDGETLFMSQNKKIDKKIQNIQRAKEFKNNFVAADIETFQIKEEGGIKKPFYHSVNPYLASFFDGENYFSYHLTDFASELAMFTAFISGLAKVAEDRLNQGKGRNLVIYFHNLANYDIFFFLKYIIQSCGSTKNIRMIKNGGNVISLKYIIPLPDNKRVNLIFMDSLQLLPGSLKSLGESFNSIGEQKWEFDHSKMNEHNLLEHKIEAINYCQQDCLTLFRILDGFANIVYRGWRLNFSMYPTITSLTYAIFRSSYLKTHNIPELGGDIFNAIKLGYTGGATDLFIPHFDRECEKERFAQLNKDKLLDLELSQHLIDAATDLPRLDLSQDEHNIELPQQPDSPLYEYDVNSLYPFIMATQPVPCGEVFYFEGDILKRKEFDQVGFFYCNVTTPEYLEHPPLQIHHDNMTFSPLGTFQGMFYSEEIHNAIKIGYKFEVLWGYYFSDSKIIFKEFIEDIYKLRLKYPKSDPMNYVAKLLMNSLYGRMGLNPMRSELNFYTVSEFNKMIEKWRVNKNHEILDVVDFHFPDQDKFLVEEIKNKSKGLVESNFINNNSSVAVAAAITAHARMFMGLFKNHPHIKLYYTDTDSLFINLSPEELNDVMNDSIKNVVNKTGLGKLKLEAVINRAVFLAPKCYYLERDDGKVIVKIKGVKKEVIDRKIKEGIINYEFFKGLLVNGSSQVLKQTKWMKNFKNSISILETEYTIKQNSNKRKLIYDADGVCVNTTPFVLDGLPAVGFLNKRLAESEYLEDYCKIEANKFVEKEEAKALIEAVKRAREIKLEEKTKVKLAKKEEKSKLKPKKKAKGSLTLLSNS